MPGSAFPLETWYSKIWLDKWVHIGLFAVLVVGWCWALSGKQLPSVGKQKVFLIITIIALLYGIGMEFVQRYFVVNRSFDGGDIIADGIGALAGFWFSSRTYIKK